MGGVAWGLGDDPVPDVLGHSRQLCWESRSEGPSCRSSARRPGIYPYPVEAQEWAGTHCSRTLMLRYPGGVWHSSKATLVLFPICSSRTPMRMFLMTLSRRIL